MHVYIVTEWSVDYDGWQRGNKREILVTSDPEKVWVALGKGEPGWDVYGAGDESEYGYQAFSYGDDRHGKRREARKVEVTP